MEGVARFMQQRADVAVDANRIHEDERHLSESERLAVSPRRFALAVVEVQQVRVGHAPVVGSELRIHVCEYGARTVDEGGDVIEWLQSPPALRVRGDVPRG